MGDVPNESGAGPQDYNDNNQDASHLVALKPSPHPSPGAQRPPSGNAPFYSQYSSLPANHQRADPSRYTQQPGMHPYAFAPNQNQPGAGFDMSAMTGALPNYGTHPAQQHPQAQLQHQDQRRLSGASTPGVVYQLQQNVQYPQGGAAFVNPASYPGFNAVQYGGYGPGQVASNVPYSPYGPSQSRPVPASTQFAQYPQQLSPSFYYFPGTFTAGSPSAPFPNQPGQTPFGYGPRSGSTSSFGPQGPQDIDGRPGMGTPYSGSEDNRLRREPSESNLGTVPRGPPRKPKQSGHALWVGNLPPGATVLDLKDHFSRDATRDIESLFLISKSNCGFVNYRTEASCVAAMQRFHDSRFQGVRLVCRLRRTSTPSSSTPVGPSATSARRSSFASSSRSPTQEESTEDVEDTEHDVEEPKVDGLISPPRATEKFFIVKSLTLQDLEQSVRNGIWATQAHNEQALNKAYETADNVYLIFSANKSGEYFGYARMTSAISADAVEIKRLTQQAEAAAADAPRKIPTPATEFAPKGHIIDDSARGTIFWEADLSDIEDEDEENAATKIDSDTEGAHDKPFRVEWMSTNRLPFYRTRGLRNPWNANREVKIARDGTELETSVGKRLVQMFHRLGPATGPVIASSSGPREFPHEMSGPFSSQTGF